MFLFGGLDVEKFTSISISLNSRNLPSTSV